MDKRERNRNIAEETLEIIKRGFYYNDKGIRVDIKEDVKKSVDGTKLYREGDIIDIEKHIDYGGTVEVTMESSLMASKRLIEEGHEKVACLNFASAKNPGGGFLKGSLAQEESIARASGLYECLKGQGEMYEYNRKVKTGLYSNYLIYSPDVPVFRDDNGNLLKDRYLVSFISCPAVNAGIVRERESVENIKKIPGVMKWRIKRILEVGVYHGNEVIVLGAWGCGVFKNDPLHVANYFKEVLTKYTDLRRGYKKIVFAIYRDKYIYDIFNRVLGKI